jgi:hypothetical protein
LIDVPVTSTANFVVKHIQIPNKLLGNTLEYIRFKRDVADMMITCKSPLTLPILGRSRDLVGFFIVRWLMDEKGESRDSALMKYAMGSGSVGMTKTKYLDLLTHIYGMDYPAYVRPTARTSSRSDASTAMPIPLQTTSDLTDPTRGTGECENLWAEIRPFLAHFGLSFRLTGIGQLTRPVASGAAKNPNLYLAMPEPKGHRCFIFMIHRRIRLLFEDDTPGGFSIKDPSKSRLNGVEVPFDMSLFEGYLHTKES